MKIDKKGVEKLFKGLSSVFIYLPDFIIKNGDGKIFIRKYHQIYRDPYSFTKNMLHTFDISNENENLWIEMSMLLTEKEHNKIFKKHNKQNKLI